MPIDALPTQRSLPTLCPITEAVSAMSGSGAEERGAIYTRREVVDFILDLAGYTSDRPLYKFRLLEPSFGEGDFLLPAIERLLESWKQAGKGEDVLSGLSSSVRAVELHKDTFEATSEKVLLLLRKHKIQAATARKLLDQWLIQGDFLLFDLPHQFDCVVGNPPYVRQERIPDILVAEYRRRFTTLFDRADLYIPFIEHSLNSLAKAGSLGFICSDRWMKNKYGGPLRAMVAQNFHLKAYVDMVDTDAFHSEVIAYPAITIISRKKGGKTRIAHKPEIKREALAVLSKGLTSKKLPVSETRIKEIAGVASGADPWILESTDQLAIMRRLESTLPLLEDAGCKVGIGVATGADKAFIGPFESLDVEPDRKLPLARTYDILGGQVEWRGDGIINPFAKSGGLVDLEQYPKLKAYLEDRRDLIAGRYVAKKSPARWYRTIDRIYPELAAQEKLLIPDIKGDAHIVYESGELYPHHNLYYITAKEWDLRALQTVLMSGIARLFVSIYSTKMRGGYLRFQAQYLRRIRVPYWNDVPVDLREQLRDAAINGDTTMGNEAVYQLYDLNKDERAALGGNGLQN
ncbi:Eco57I restriction-modification methylase domain-containing protein [Marinimicrobium sp. ABcell2]|uniref:Eco57I restriction-modification methylase domain-containing protein n=1 Tax=Marinimicrobium sp. ABcell2 TaxID=3069751 RepID=UPI0027B0C3DA|nr:Eco57I restriction-modification methylase domain-containing protein [Marinimicrobium sp. ABcell2]MDQ2077481.1 Eco57I restriction-modification methylase domain-containing protein [Marinimicrobium sp. ABcell2]